MKKSFAFFGRETEIEELRSLHALRKHVLIVGPAGIGKTSLLRRIRQQSPLLICENTSSLRRICDSIEQQLGWIHYKLNVVERKNRLLARLVRRGEAVAFDQVVHTPPRVARFIAILAEKIPVWIACRSDRPHEIGHVWEHLYRFTRLELVPFTAEDTRQFILEAIAEGNVQPDAREHLDELYRMSEGNPRVLEELLIELASREYKMDGVCGLDLLDLDRRIHAIDRAIKTTAMERRS
jgi:AAA ATPase domain